MLWNSTKGQAKIFLQNLPFVTHPPLTAIGVKMHVFIFSIQAIIF